MDKETIYRITFVNQGKVYELFARDVHQSNLLGFIEIEKLEFGEKTSVVVDPSEETLKSEFDGVTRTYVPMHSVLRIDEVAKRGQAKITELGDDAGKVTPFPVFAQPKE